MVNADAVSAERLMLTSAVGGDFRRCSRRVKMRSFTNGSRSKTTSKPSKLGASYSTQHPQLYRELTVTLVMTCAASHHCRHPAHCRCGTRNRVAAPARSSRTACMQRFPFCATDR